MTPNLWTRVFLQLGHPAFMLIGASVCRSWRAIAFETVVGFFDANGMLRAGQSGYDLIVAHNRPYRWIYIVMRRGIVCTAVVYEKGARHNWLYPSKPGIMTAGMVPLVDYRACRRCNKLYRGRGRRPLPGFAFCGSVCLKAVLEEGLEDSSSQ